MAYTKYSLTPSSNTAAPPDGAPEGMLPSAVNDTMRDMMAQIRDCGDGIRDGTYTMTAPKITGGTITGSTINNSAIGGTTAAAGAFTTLSATGVTTVQAGTVSLPAITTTGDTNTGIFFPAADTIAFTEGGVEAMRIDSDGELGVGTTSPTARVHAYSATAMKQLTVDGAGTIKTGINFANSGTTYGQIYFDNNSPFDMSVLQQVSIGSLRLGTNDTERMRIDSSGNVGIGTSSPQANLQVGASSDVTIAMSNSSSVTSGNRGTISMFNSGASTVGYIRFGAVTDNVGTDIQFGIRPVGGSVTEAMRITSGGILQVNTTASAPSTGSDAKLMVKGNDGVIDCYSNSNGAGYYCITFRNNNANNSGVQGYITISTTSVAYTSVSDYRLKENVQPMTGALAKVSQLKPVTYTWKTDGSNGQGFIAHELQEVVPEAVTGEKDAVNKDDSIKAQGVDTSFLVATLTAAIQELNAKVVELEAKLNAK
jgi:hypothetical protein